MAVSISESRLPSNKKSQVIASVIDEIRETRLLEKRARIRRRSLVGSLIFRSMTKGATTKIVSEVRSVTNKQAMNWFLRSLRQLLRLKFRTYHAPSLVLHIKAETRRSAT